MCSTIEFLLLLNFAGFLTCLVLPDQIGRVKINYIKIATAISLFSLALGAKIAFDFFIHKQNIEISAIKFFGKRFFLHLDGISVLLIFLSSLIFPIALNCIPQSLKNHIEGGGKELKTYASLFLLLEFFSIGVFAVDHLVLFYIFFEGTILPMFFIIGLWGGKERSYSMYKIFIYTFASSIPFLVAIAYIISLGSAFPTLRISTMIFYTHILPVNIQTFLWCSMMLAFAVKLPLFPFHTWLPNAHVDAPASGSVILAAILIKIGGYGIIRMPVAMFPDISAHASTAMVILGVISVIYAATIAITQSDIKKMMAYSSISHMGFVIVAIFSLSELGTVSAVFQMISHGLISAALFFSIGVIYDRLNTREFSQFGGIAKVMPRFAILLMIFTMANAGLPITSGFIGEFLTIIASYNAHGAIALPITLGVVLGATYMLTMYKRTMLGQVTNSSIPKMNPLTTSELLCLSALAVPIILIGIFPTPIINAIKSSY